MRIGRFRGSGHHLSEPVWTALIVAAAVLIALLSSGRPGPSRSDSQSNAASDPSRLSPSMVLLVTGDEPIRELFTRAGCPVCHTIPGIGGADGRVGPTLVMGTTGLKRLADPLYRGRAKTVKEYLIKSIREPGAYVAPGYPDRTMPHWYGQKLSAGALEKIAVYLEQITEENPSSQ